MDQAAELVDDLPGHRYARTGRRTRADEPHDPRGLARRETAGVSSSFTSGRPTPRCHGTNSPGAKSHCRNYRRCQRKEANDEWREAEVKQAEGRGTDPRRGRQRLRQYVEQTWLPNHVIEVSTLEAYTYQINRHIVPHFGNMWMIDILPSHVRERVTKLRNEGVKPKNLSNIKLILSAIFTTAFTDKVIFLHPCAGVKVPTAPTRPLTIITPEQFDLLYAALETPSAQLLVETEIETGLRMG